MRLQIFDATRWCRYGRWVHNLMTTYPYYRKYGFLITAFLTAFLFFHPVLIFGKTFFLRDMHRFFYPMKSFLAQSLKTWNIPYWWPNNYCGEPFLSSVQSGVFYPPSLLFALFPFPLSLNMYVVLHFIIGFCFFYLFVTAMGFGKRSAIITAISFCYGGFTISAINVLNNLTTLVWLPAILWSLHRYGTDGGYSYFFASILFLSVSLLGGEPQLFILIFGIAVLYLLTLGLKNRVSLVKIVLLPIMLAAAIGIAMIQLGPLYIDYLNSVRVDGIGYREAAEYSMDPAMAKHLILPLIFSPEFSVNPESLTGFFPGQNGLPWLLTIYPGFIILPAALYGVCIDFSGKNLLWISLFLIGIVLSVGDHVPFYRWVYEIFPYFRYPAKFMMVAGFSLLILAARGLDIFFLHLEQKGASLRMLPLLMGLILTSDLYLAHNHLNPVCDTAFYSRHHPVFNPVLQDQDLFRVYVDRRITTGEGERSSILNTHLVWQLFQMPNLGVLKQISHVDGQAGLELGYQYLMTELLRIPWEQKIDFLRMANTKYIVTPDPLLRIPELSGKLEQINSLVYRLTDPLPRAWLVGHLKSPERPLLDELSAFTYDPKVTALTQAPIVGAYEERFFKPVERVEYKQNGTIVVRATVDAPSVLVLAESAYPGWRLWVDGVERSGFKANYFFQGIELKKGSHRIEFQYRPAHFIQFTAISLISVALLIIGWGGYFVSRRRTGPAERGLR